MKKGTKEYLKGTTLIIVIFIGASIYAFGVVELIEKLKLDENPIKFAGVLFSSIILPIWIGGLISTMLKDE